MDIVSLYDSILSAAGLRSDLHGFVSTATIPNSTVTTPIMVDGKRLVLPTREQLTAPDNGSTIIFHPLYENIMDGESAVISKLRKAFMVRLNSTTMMVGSQLLEICATVEEHRKLSPDQSEMLSAVGPVDAHTLENFVKIAKKAFQDNAEQISMFNYLENFYLKL